MAEDAPARPLFTKIMACGSDPSDNTITFSIATDDDKGMHVDIALELVGPLMAAIAAEASSLMAVLPDDQRDRSATLKTRSISVGITETGSPVLLIELANGALLPLEATQGDLAGFAAELASVSAPPGRKH